MDSCSNYDYPYAQNDDSSGPRNKAHFHKVTWPHKFKTPLSVYLKRRALKVCTMQLIIQSREITQIIAMDFMNFFEASKSAQVITRQLAATAAAIMNIHTIKSMIAGVCETRATSITVIVLEINMCKTPKMLLLTGWSSVKPSRCNWTTKTKAVCNLSWKCDALQCNHHLLKPFVRK